MKTYDPAEEVQALAEGKVVPQWNAECDGASIAYLFTDDLGSSKGWQNLAHIRKATAVERCLTSYDFVLVVDRLVWAKFDTKKRLALVDHEFCHLSVDADGKLSVVGHDLEEFCAVVRRHGAWLDDISLFNQAQMDLFSEGRKEA